MTSKQSWKIPQHLDEPYKIMFLSVPKAIALMVCVLAGIMLEVFFYSLGLIVLILIFSRQIAHYFKDGMDHHAAFYWYRIFTPKKMFPGWIRFLRG